jgi:hypothetical protein
LLNPFPCILPHRLTLIVPFFTSSCSHHPSLPLPSSLFTMLPLISSFLLF